jgi:hypothetical protein
MCGVKLAGGCFGMVRRDFIAAWNGDGLVRAGTVKLLAVGKKSVSGNFDLGWKGNVKARLSTL